jgi:hypothetical protein
MAGTVDMYHVIKGLKPPASSSISILPYYGLSDNFIVLIGKISMFFLKKSRMELKCKCYDVTDVEVLNVFYHTKSSSDTETDFLRHRIIQVLDRIYNVTFRDANLYSPSCLPCLEPE